MELADIPELIMRQRSVIFDYDTTLGTWYAIEARETCSGEFPREINEGIFDKTGRILICPYTELRLIAGTWKAVLMSPERLGLPVNLLIQRMTIQDYEVVPMSLVEKQVLDSAMPIRKS